MPTPISLTVDGHTFEAELNDTKTAQAVVGALPLESSAHRWGDEYYFSTSVTADEGDPTDDVFEVGGLGFWPPGDAFCIFFGPTPASHGSEPRMANPGVVIGKILGDTTPLKSLGGSVPVKVELS